MNQTAKNQAAATGAGAGERISILLDGEMDRSEAEAFIASVCADAALRRQWHELHRAGDALRSNEVGACDATGFCARVTAAITSEPTVLAPRSARNPAGVRRYWIPGLAVAASIAAVGFVAIPLLRTPDTTSLSKSSVPMEVAVIEAGARKALPTIVNARELNASFNPYLAAHRELIGNSVVPRAAVYLRSAEDR